MEEHKQPKNTPEGPNHFPAAEGKAGEQGQANYQLPNCKEGERQALYLIEKHNMNHHVLQGFTISNALKSATNLHLIPQGHFYVSFTDLAGTVQTRTQAAPY